MPIVSQGNSVVVDVGAHEGLWIKSTGNAEVTINQVYAGTPDVINVTTDTVRVGFYGEPVTVAIRAVSGEVDYQDTTYAYEKLTATQQGDRSDSSPMDVAQAVNNLQDGTVGFDSILLKGLPQTAGAPVGFGDLGSALNKDPVMAFEPENWGGWFAQTSFGDFIYGRKSSDPLRVYRSGSDLVESSYGNAIVPDGPAPHRIGYVAKVLDNNTIIAAVEDGQGRYRFYKTSDTCQTWSLVFTSELTQVRPISDRSILDATVQGGRVLFYAEYNVNPLGTGTTPESKLVLWRSNDSGSTWTEVTRWNTAGVNNTRHMHCIKQFEPNGAIYVCFGDTDPQSAIVRWDGVTAWPINTSWQDLPVSEGLKVFFGRQAARAVDLVESDGRIYYLNDTYSAKRGDASDNAMWSFKPDLTDFRIESSPTSLVAEHAGWLGCKDSQGRVFFISAPDATLVTGSRYIGVISSNKTKTQWELCGAFRALNSASSMVPMGFMCVNDTLLLSSTNGSGKGSDNTASFKVSDHMKCRVRFQTAFIPDTVHPVYWVDSLNGNNANNGLKPTSPFRDFSHPIAGDRVPYGASIQLMQPFTTFTDASTIIWKSNAASNQGDTSEPVTIRGYGASKTHIQYSATGAITSSVFSVSGGNRMRACFADLTVSTAKPLRLFDSSQTSGQDNLLEFTRCIIGDPTKIVSGLIRSHTLPVMLFSSIVESNRDSYALTSTTVSTEPLNVTLDSSLMLSSLAHFHVTNTSTNNAVRMYNSKLYNSSIASFNITGAAAFSTFVGWDNEISSTYPQSLGYVGAVSGGGTFSSKMQSTTVRGLTGNSTAFADTCKLDLYTEYRFKQSDYID